MDVKCVVCGEPWDFYGIDHGDMSAWEADLFKKGSGCPCCKGVVDGEPFEPKGISDLEYGDLDPMLRINALENFQAGKAPEWKKPEPVVYWTCDGCGVEVIGDPEFPKLHVDHLQYHVPFKSKAFKWYSSHPFQDGVPDDKPAHVFEGGEKVCEFCHKTCDRCGRSVCSTIEFGDMYDDGVSFNLEYHNELVCIDCLENSCPDCQSSPDECTCNQNDDDDV